MEEETKQEMNNEQNDGEERKKGKIKYNLKYPVPEVRSSLERDIKILKAFTSASNYGQKFIGAKDVAPFVGCNQQIVGGVLAFFSKIGLALKEGFNYKPTQETVNIVNKMKFESEQEAGKVLKPLIVKTWFGDMAIKIFKTDNLPLSHDELFKRLGTMCGADPNYHKGAINRIIEYLGYSHLIEYEKDTKKYSLKGNIDEATMPEENVPSLLSKEEKIKKNVPLEKAGRVMEVPHKNLPSDIQFPQIKINISLNIDNNIDENKFRNILKILKQEFVNDG